MTRAFNCPPFPFSIPDTDKTHDKILEKGANLDLQPQKEMLCFSKQ